MNERDNVGYLSGSKKTARFVVWYRTPSLAGTGELDAMLRRLNLQDLSDLHGISSDRMETGLAEEISSFLENWGHGRVCVAVPARVVQLEQPGHVLMSRSVAYLQLSVRASNCLHNAAIRTIADLVRWRPVELRRLPNMGIKSVNEVIASLGEHGIGPPLWDEPFLLGSAELIDPRLGLLDGEFRIETLLTLAETGVNKTISSCLARQGIRALADLVVLEASWAQRSAGLSAEDFVELNALLRHLRLRWGMGLPSWQREHSVELRDAFADEISQARCWAVSPEPEAEMPTPPPTSVTNSLTEELESLFPKRTDARDRTIVSAYLGLHGEPPRTLEAVGAMFDVTRERVRQIALPFEEALGQAAGQLLWLEEALSCLTKIAPCRVDEAEQELQSCGIVTSRLHVESLLKLAERATLGCDLLVPERTRVLITRSFSKLVETAASEAARQVSHWGVANRRDVLMQIGAEPTAKWEEVLWGGLPDVIWLDPDRNYLWLQTGKNSAGSRLARILSVAPDISQEEAYEGVFRDGRLSQERLPFTVFEAFCQQFPWCEVSQGRIRATAGLPSATERSDDDILVEILREMGGVGWRQDLWLRARSAGVGKPNFDRLLSDSI